MCLLRTVRSTLRCLAAGVGLAAATYSAKVIISLYRYGRPAPPSEDEVDASLDGFMPAYEVVKRFQVRVAAPPEITLATASELDILRSPIIRAIFWARAFILGGGPAARLMDPAEPQRPRGLVAWMQMVGWGVLSEIPGREIVFGSVTRPWEANPGFRGLAPEEFAAFREPGFVKIVWSLRSDPVGQRASVFRHETRATTTDARSRVMFRRYWSLASPGMTLIRWLALEPLKREAERRAHEVEQT